MKKVITAAEMHTAENITTAAKTTVVISSINIQKYLFSVTTTIRESIWPPRLPAKPNDNNVD